MLLFDSQYRASWVRKCGAAKSLLCVAAVIAAIAFTSTAVRADIVTVGDPATSLASFVYGGDGVLEPYSYFPAGDPSTWNTLSGIAVGYNWNDRDNATPGNVEINGGSQVSVLGYEIGGAGVRYPDHAGAFYGGHGAAGTTTVTGTGSMLSCDGDGDLSVGEYAAGTLNIFAGGRVTNPLDSYIGVAASANGVINVDGEGSNWTSGIYADGTPTTGNLNVRIGGDGAATLNITNGATVTNNVGDAIRLAHHEGSSGAVRVDGEGSTWTVSKVGLGTSQIFAIGCSGTGSIEITNGGVFNSNIKILAAQAPPDEAYGTAAILVDGAGSMLNITPSVTIGSAIGQGGTATMTITNGGVANFTKSVLLATAQVTGQSVVTVDGADSAWNCTGNTSSSIIPSLCIGYTGAGTVNLQNNGTLVTAQIVGGYSASGSMTLNFNGGILKARGANKADWISRKSGTANIYVMEGGAKIDTDGLSMGIGDMSNSLSFQHAGAAAIDGGLTKLGAGTLTLSGHSTYTGWTGVNAGVLSISHAYLYDAGNVHVDAGAAFDLAFSGSDTIHYLFLGGLAMAAGTYDVSNSDGYITGSGSLFASATALQGDADLNGTVNSTDLGLLLSHYNQVGAGFAWGLGDFDANGTVNSTDLGLLLSHYNQVSAATSAVPEPSTLLLLAAGLVGLLAYAWRKK